MSILPDSPPVVKTCPQCGREFPATPESFYSRKSSADGLFSKCKPCHIAGVRRWQRANYKQHREGIGEWQQANPEKIRAIRRRWQQAHPEKHRAGVRKWQQAHPEQRAALHRNRRARLRRSEGTHTAEDIQTQYENQKGKCYYCGRFVGQNYHVDHVLPLALGGSNGPENLVVACPKCNISKHAKHPMDFCGRLL